MTFTAGRLILSFDRWIYPLIGTSSKRFASTAANYRYLLTANVGERRQVGLLTLNCPKKLNALFDGLTIELISALDRINHDETIEVIIITGQGKAFCAGADISMLYSRPTYAANVKSMFLETFTEKVKSSKPIIAAVNGYAFGGGCELAMMCDIIYASENALFGQQEITVGAIPGAGGTQLIPRFCGKSKAMEMCLTGDPVTAEVAERMGLVSKVFPDEKLLPAAVQLAERISSHSPLIVSMCKEAVNTAFETTLAQGLRYERSIFNSTFATEDRKEGMTAFVEKRKPVFKNC